MQDAIFSICKERGQCIVWPVCFSVLLFLVAVPQVSAVGCTFASAGDSDFNNAANWSCGNAPTSADDVTIPASTSTTMTASSTINTLSVSGTLNASAFNLTVATGSTIFAGGTVTSTSGTMNFNSTVTSTGAIGSNSGDMSFVTAIQNNGTFNIGSGTVTSTGIITNATNGIINNNAGLLSTSAGIVNSGTFNANVGTLRFFGSSNRNITGGTFYNISSIKTAGTITFVTNPVIISNNLTVSPSGTTGISSGSFAMTVNGTTTIGIGGTVTSTSETLTFSGAVTSTGVIGSGTGRMSFASTFQNNGVFAVGSGTATTTGAFTNASTTNNNTGTLSIVGDFTNTGTYNADTGTFRLAGSGTQSVTGATFNNVVSIKDGGVATFVTTAPTVSGTFTSATSTGTVSAGSVGMTVTGTATIGSGATVTSTSGVITFSGAVTSTGSIGSTSGGSVFGSTFQNNGNWHIGSGSSTMVGTLTNAASGVIRGGSGTLRFAGNWTNGGSLLGQSGTVAFSGTSTQSIAAETGFANVSITNTDGTVSLGGNVTLSSTLSLSSSVTLAIGTRTLTVPGAITNSGLMTISSGSIVHTAESIDFTDSSGTTQSGYTVPANLYVTIQDSNRNVDGTSIETMTVVLTSASGESETVTLTETGVATGIFRNASAFPLVSASSITTSNSQFDLTVTENGTATYTDALDNADVATDVVTMTFTSSASSGGGGGTEAIGIFVVRPGGGQIVNAGSQMQVMYSVGGSGITAVRISLSTDDGLTFVVIADNQPLTGSYIVSVPNVQTSTARVRVEAKIGSSIVATSIGTNFIILYTPRTVSLPTTPSVFPQVSAPVHALVKLADDGNALIQTDSAVYYIGSDGMRHAFPNAGVYLTWYPDFSSVQVIAFDQLSMIPLGKNVTYKPGLKMVKFMTDPKVYAIAQDGRLRWITSERTAQELYGLLWNKNIDDIDDALYVNYRFGSAIGSLADFDPAAVSASVTVPSDSLQLY